MTVAIKKNNLATANEPPSSKELAPSSYVNENRYMKWWLEDYPPISGRLRFAVHVGLWYFATRHSKSYFHLVDYYEETDPEFFTPRSFFGLIFGGGGGGNYHYYYIDPQIIRIIIGITKVAWVAAAVGLCTDLSSAVTAIGTVFLQGYLLDASGGNRGFYVPSAAFVAMAFSKNRRDDVWSIDYHIQKRLRQWRRRGIVLKQDNEESNNNNKIKNDNKAATANDSKEEEEEEEEEECRTNYSVRSSIRETGFARKCLLVYIAGFYWASGMAKLYSAGFRWADGSTLHACLYKRAGGTNTLVNILVAYPKSIGMISSVGALFLEVGAFLALYLKFRPWFLFGWALMHIMIEITMERSYEQNAWCYLLLINWDEVTMSPRTTIWAKRWWRWWPLVSNQEERQDTTKSVTTDDDNNGGGGHDLDTNAATGSTKSPSTIPMKDTIGDVPSTTTTTTTITTLPKSSATFAVRIGTCLLLAMAAQATFQIEWWPFTNVDMYSSYREGDTIRYSYHKSKYNDPIAAQEITTSWGNRQAKGYVAHHVKIQLFRKKPKVGLSSSSLDENEEYEYYYNKKKKLEIFGVVRLKQWIKSVMTDVVVDDFRAKPKGTIAYDPENFPDNPASLFLLRILPSLKRNVENWERYEYVILTYKTPEEAGPDPVIASIPLDDTKLKDFIEKIEKLKMTRQKAGWWWGGNTYYTTPSSDYMKTNTVLVLVAHLCVIVCFRVHVFLKRRSAFEEQ